MYNAIHEEVQVAIWGNYFDGNEVTETDCYAHLSQKRCLESADGWENIIGRKLRWIQEIGCHEVSSRNPKTRPLITVG